MLERLNKWATSTGGSGHIASSIPSQNSVSIPTNTLYSKLTKSSLEVVLAYVDYVDEQTWTDTSNVLARVYGEEGRPYFHSYSSGVYAGASYPNMTKRNVMLVTTGLSESSSLGQMVTVLSI